MSDRKMRLISKAPLLLVLLTGVVAAKAVGQTDAAASSGKTVAPVEHSSGLTVIESAEEIQISGEVRDAAIRKRGYVSGVRGGSLLDRKTGARDLGYGLDIVDWIMEPG